MYQKTGGNPQEHAPSEEPKKDGKDDDVVDADFKEM
jgi:hypothetical protein